MMQKRFFVCSFIIALIVQACSEPTSSNEDPAQVPETDVTSDKNLVNATASVSNINPSEDNIFCEDVETNYDPAGFSQTGGRFVVLDDPLMIAAAQATWLDSHELVLGVEQNGEAHAFPVFQMVYHHIANTTVGGEPYLVTY